MDRKNNFYTFNIFDDDRCLIQAISTRQLGDMSGPGDKNRGKFLALLGLNLNQFITAQQVHGNQIAKVGRKDCMMEIKGVDGLLTCQKNVVLGIRSADCPQLIAFDSQNRIFGVAHAGWRGIIKKIGVKLIKLMIKNGSNPQKILVAIGPHIQACCYLVNQRRINNFVDVFGQLDRMYDKKQDGFYLNLSVPLVFQLVSSGVRKEQIEVTNLCTVCQNNEFFSFRKEGRPFGEFLTVASIKEN
jgi:YfiH family protein